MRGAGLVVARTLETAARAPWRPASPRSTSTRSPRRPSATTAPIPSFLGYHGYPGSICTSVNDEVVHGIPGDRVLREGDQISIDCGAILAGWHGDAAITVGVGRGRPGARRALPGHRGGAVGRPRRRPGRRHGSTTSGSRWRPPCAPSPAGPAYGIVEEYVGHGIGTSMHMEPNVPNYASRAAAWRSCAGMALAVEPMVCAGDRAVHTLADDWTVVTTDGLPRLPLGAHGRADRRRALGPHRARRRRRALRQPSASPARRALGPDPCGCPSRVLTCGDAAPSGGRPTGMTGDYRPRAF